MSKVAKVTGIALLAFASLAWLVLGGRLLSIPLLVGVAILFVLPSTRRRTKLIGTVWLAWLASTFLPFDITLSTAPSGPKFVRCCPGAPYQDYQAALQKDRAGTCRFCSDIVGPNEPTYFLVW